MTESDFRRLQVKNAMLNRQVQALTKDVATERSKAEEAREQRLMAEGNFVEALVCANKRYREIIRERDQALAQKGELAMILKANQEKVRRMRDVGLLMLLVFVCVFGVMILLASNGKIPLWTTAVPLAAVMSVAYITGWSV